MDNSFGTFFKQKRQEKNLTQKQLANLLFVSESTISKWEKDVAHPDITLLPKLSEILGVTEHELITASIDKQTRKEKIEARKWRIFSASWDMFFYIAYALALIPCFICNLAIDKTLSWFWIVAFALLLAFSFTNLPKLIKKYRLILIPLSMFLSLCILLATCAIYTKGNWFWIAFISVLFVLITIFTPIFISKYELLSKIRKYNDFISIFVDFLMLNILLIVINLYTLTNNYSTINWYFSIALPIVIFSYIFLNLLLCVRFLKINKLLKTSIILSLIDILYFIPPLLKVKNLEIQKQINDFNIFKSNFSNWQVDVNLDNNIHCIIFFTILTLAIIFLIFGLFINHKKNKK